MTPVVTRTLTVAATLAAGAAVSLSPSVGEATRNLALLVAVGVGWLIVLRRPHSPVGPALAWCSAAVALSMTADYLADGALGPAVAGALQNVAVGLWPLNLAGVCALLLVFPDGRPAGRLWRFTPWLFGLAAVAVAAGMWGSRLIDGQVTGHGAPWQMPATIGGLAGIGAAMVLAVGSSIARFRRGDERAREQLKWLMLAGVFTVAALIGGWLAESLGVAVPVAYAPFIAGIVILTPVAVAVAVVRHDLLDIDRLLSEGAAWLITLVACAVVFGVAVFTVAQFVHEWTAAGAALAAFLAALTLLPIHGYLHRGLSRVIDRDRQVAVAAVERFAADIRSGRREPEAIEAVLRQAQGDPGLRLLLANNDAWVDLDGTRHDPGDQDDGITLESGGVPVARLDLTHDTPRARRRASALLGAGWVPLEVSRLRLSLRQSQARLAVAAAEERVRLERDLHDGVQQRLVATGMRLSMLQRRLDKGSGRELGVAVDELLEAVEELRRLAQGVRPSRLDDGLGPALAWLAASSPVPLDLLVADDLPDVGNARTHAAFMTVTEAVANALKHANASRIEVAVDGTTDRLQVRICDDGVGGAPELVTLRDRLRAVGGELTIDSPAGGGTTVTAVV